jgi:hypothetical protein
MPKIMLKSPEEYQRELELYKQLKNNVYTIFKTPEFQRQEMVQQLKLESEAKDAARELTRIEEETKEPEISEVVDMENFRDLNNLLEQDLDIFTTDALNEFTKNELIETKDILNIIKRVDKGKGITKKSIYINDAIDAIDMRLRGSVKKPKASKPSTSKPVDDGEYAASAEPATSTDVPDKERKQDVSAEDSNLPQEIKFMVETGLYKKTPSALEKEINNNKFTLEDIQNELERYFDILKKFKSDIPVKDYNRIYAKLTGRKDKFEEIQKSLTTGRGLSKSKSKSKPKSKSKSNNLGKQDQIYYILSKRAGNNNKLMKKRLKK